MPDAIDELAELYSARNQAAATGCCYYCYYCFAEDGHHLECVVGKPIAAALVERDRLRDALEEIAKFGESHKGDENYPWLLHSLTSHIPKRARQALAGAIGDEGEKS